MYKKKIFIFLFFIALSFVQAKDTLITLQNGYNDYSGCDDATIYLGYYDSLPELENYGNDTSLTILKYNFGETR